MQVHIEDLSPVEKKLDVEIPWERVKEKLDAAYRELGKGVQLRGFRRGKVPRQVLEQMFGQKVSLEVARELVQESFLQAAQEHRIEPVAEPVVDDARIRSGQAFRYSARIEVRGPVELKSWEGLELTRRPVVVTDEEVSHALEHKRMQHTDYRTISGRAETAESDVLIVAVKGNVGEFPIDRPELAVDLGHTDHEPLPGISRALTGIPLDAREHEITLQIPEDVSMKEIAGKEAKLTVTVKEAREKVVPELDDEFAKDTGEADTLEELKQKIRKELEDQARAEIDGEVREQALKRLVEKNPTPVAPALIERGVDSQLQRLRIQLAMQGIDFERAGVDVSEMRERLRKPAEEEIQAQLLLEAIADGNQIEVAEDEVDARVAEMAKMRDKPPQKLKAEMDRDGSLDSLRWRLRQEKALDLVVSRATITEASPEETSKSEPQEKQA